MLETLGKSIVDVVQQLSMARSMERVVEIVSRAARNLTNADGATFILREADKVYYVDENAIGPLWKGRKFPISGCISGIAITRREAIFIPEVEFDPRIPFDLYKETFVKSLFMVPVRMDNPIAAIGIYWAKKHDLTPEEKETLTAIANSTSIAIENIQLLLSLQESNDSLSKSLKARDEFLSIVSHELKTPLSALKLQLQMTQKKFKITEPNLHTDQVNKTFDRSLIQVDSLTKLVSKLLDFSLIQLEMISLDYTPLNLSQVLGEMIEAYRTQLQSINCDLTLKIEDDIVGEWDKERLGQIVNNIFSNIIKYAPGTPVSVCANKFKNAAVLLFEDSGPGIPQEFQERMFQRFERAKSRHNISGMGLGLFIIKRLVEAHFGTLEVSSYKGQGVKIRITLPLGQTLS